MATKPVLGAYVWSPDVNYTTGPAPLIGTATKITPPIAESDEGWNADERPPAQWENFSINYLTQWASDWVRLGSNAAGADAHLVETDAAGIARVVDLFAGGFSQANSGRGPFGDGSDGALAAAGGTTTLNRDTYHTDVDLNATDIIETNGFRLFASGTVTIAAGGLIQHNGADGADGSAGGAGGAAAVAGSMGAGSAGGAGGTTGGGTNGTGHADGVGGDGGAGGPSSSDSGGLAGPSTAPALIDGGFHHLEASLGNVFGAGVMAVLRGGAGGGGGGGDPGNLDTAGGGGGGAGVMSLRFLRLVNNGTIRANGGDGGDRELGAADDPGGGGGGGGGGIFLVTRESTGAGAVEVNGGAPGADGDGAGPAVAGVVGEIILLSS